MNETGIRIMKLINTPGKTAPDFTHALKMLGGGDSMQEGLKRVAVYMNMLGKSQGYKNGEKSGWIKGTVVTSAVFLIPYIIKKIGETLENKKMQQVEGKEILKAFEESIPEEQSHDEDAPSRDNPNYQKINIDNDTEE